MRLRQGLDFIPDRPEPGSRALQKWERLFFTVGILALGIFIGVRLYSYGYQAYAEYSFEQQLNSRVPSLGGFLNYLVHKPFRIATAPPRPSPPDTATSNNDEVLRELIYGPDVAPNVNEWSRDRLRAYRDTGAPPAGSVLGKLEVPAIDLSVMLLQGTDDWTLDRAVGHIEGTALPGQMGNIGIAGHRDGFFRGLRKLAEGDMITLTTLKGRFEYRIGKISIVKPDDTRVLASTGNPTLTLVTCYPFYYVGSAPKRFIVTAEMVKSEDATQVAADKAKTR